MQNLNILLPIGLLVIAFLLKLFVDQAANTPLFVYAIYSVPVDIVFLATSFAAAFTISSPQNASRGLLALLAFLALAVIIVFMWRRSNRLFDLARYYWSAAFFVANAGLSATALFFAVKLLTEVKQ